MRAALHLTERAARRQRARLRAVEHDEHVAEPITGGRVDHIDDLGTIEVELFGAALDQHALVGDQVAGVTHQLTRAFDVHIDEEGLALRGTFIVNPDGVIKTMEVHDNAIARDVKETVRKLKAAQYVAAHPNEVCPAKWNEGAKTLKPSLDLVGKI